MVQAASCWSKPPSELCCLCRRDGGRWQCWEALMGHAQAVGGCRGPAGALQVGRGSWAQRRPTWHAAHDHLHAALCSPRPFSSRDGLHGAQQGRPGRLLARCHSCPACSAVPRRPGTPQPTEGMRLGASAPRLGAQARRDAAVSRRQQSGGGGACGPGGRLGAGALQPG